MAEDRTPELRRMLRKRVWHTMRGLSILRPADCPVPIGASRHSDHRSFLVIEGTLLVESNHPDSGVSLYGIVGDDPRIHWPGEHSTAYGSAFPDIEGGEFVRINDGDDGPWWALLERLDLDWRRAIAAAEKARKQEEERAKSEAASERERKLDSVTERLSQVVNTDA